MATFQKFTETYDIKKAYFLKNMTLDQFIEFRNKPFKTKKEIEHKFKQIQKFCRVCQFPCE